MLIDLKKKIVFMEDGFQREIYEYDTINSTVCVLFFFSFKQTIIQ